METTGVGKKNLTIALDWMHDTFKDAPVLGSLLNPAKTDAAKIVLWDELFTTLEQALKQEQSDERQEAAVVAQGLARAATLMAGQYQWVITNVPYLARGKQNEVLHKFCEKHYPEAKNDLATVFLDRCLELCSLPSPRERGEQVLLPLGEGARRANEGIIRGLDVSEPRTAAEKAAQLLTAEIKGVEQAKQLENPDARVVLEEPEETELLEKFAKGLQGISPADAPHYGRYYWELYEPDSDWVEWQSTIESTNHFGGKELLLWLGESLKAAISNGQVYLRGTEAVGKKGVVVRQMRELPCAIHTGAAFDTNCAVVLSTNKSHLPAIWCFCSSPDYNEAVRRIDQKLNVTNATLVKVPFDLDHWSKVAEEKYPNGLPKPYSDDPTQWIFHGHPCGSVVWDEEQKRTVHGPLRTDDTVLQVAVARLLGYRWPAELDAEMELADEQREWVSRSQVLSLTLAPSPLGRGGEGEGWSNDVLAELLNNAGHAGKSLEAWLRDKFFTQHCKLFHHRPFIWHIWDGLPDGFAALVNYHKFDAKLLETLIYTYLGDWISRQKQDIVSGVDGAEEKLAAAGNLKKKLELILEGEAPYDIFVRWKPIEQQPIGWEPDLNDGVRLNIRPFMTVGDVKKKGAGVLRDKLNIKWKNDRGKDVESDPWYHIFNGDRINDRHLSLAEKRTARETTE